jgi:hypothetical protein
MTEDETTTELTGVFAQGLHAARARRLPQPITREQVSFALRCYFTTRRRPHGSEEWA